MQRLPLFMAIVCFLLVCDSPLASAKDDDSQALDRRIKKVEKKLKRSESQLTNLEREVEKFDDNSKHSVALFLFGTVCALWAQNTGRNPWLWFFLGLFFSVITVLFLLAKNSSDIADQRAAGNYSN